MNTEFIAVGSILNFNVKPRSNKFNRSLIISYLYQRNPTLFGLPRAHIKRIPLFSFFDGLRYLYRNNLESGCDLIITPIAGKRNERFIQFKLRIRSINIIPFPMFAVNTTRKNNQKRTNKRKEPKVYLLHFLIGD